MWRGEELFEGRELESASGNTQDSRGSGQSSPLPFGGPSPGGSQLPAPGHGLGSGPRCSPGSRTPAAGRGGARGAPGRLAPGPAVPSAAPPTWCLGLAGDPQRPAGLRDPLLDPAISEALWEIEHLPLPPTQGMWVMNLCRFIMETALGHVKPGWGS